ncbi:hypothetical protein GGF46_000458 [Coemansia sp. RSA 552]|nr:hypothetical protein GGF46_000458 [Coemansia sp. RSA 552]
MLSVARSSAAAASVGHLALFAGGRLQNSSYTDVVDIYDRESNKWSTAHLSANRSGVGAGTLAGRYALFAGGHDAKFRPMSLVDVFDSQTKQWSQIHLHTPRASPRLLDLGNVTAVVGGLSGDLQYLSRAVEYIDARLSVSAPASLGGGYPQLGIPMVDRGRGIGLYTSGYQNNRPGDRFNDFQPSNQTTTFTASGSAAELTAGPVFPSPRWGAGGAAAEGVFVVGGGHTFNDGTDGGSLTSVTDRVDVYRAAERKWSSTPLRLSVPRDYPLVQVVGRYIVFASGTQQSKDLDIFDLQAHAFVQNLQHRPALHTLRSDAVAVTVDNCLLVIAGGTVYQGRNTTASVEFFDACPK